MTDPLTLARRVAKCPAWRWRRGMVVLLEQDGDRWPEVLEGHAVPEGWDALPDLTDPGTLGHLLALVREAWGEPHLLCSPGVAGWDVWAAGSNRAGRGATEAESLVAALEAAAARAMASGTARLAAAFEVAVRPDEPWTAETFAAEIDRQKVARDIADPAVASALAYHVDWTHGRPVVGLPSSPPLPGGYLVEPGSKVEITNVSGVGPVSMTNVVAPPPVGDEADHAPPRWFHDVRFDAESARRMAWVEAPTFSPAGLDGETLLVVPSIYPGDDPHPQQGAEYRAATDALSAAGWARVPYTLTWTRGADHVRIVTLSGSLSQIAGATPTRVWLLCPVSDVWRQELQARLLAGTRVSAFP